MVVEQKLSVCSLCNQSGGCKELTCQVIAGALNSPLVKSLFLDLERRGFIVYVIVTSIEEQSLIYGESKPDIHPLLINFDSVCATIPKSSTS